MTAIWNPVCHSIWQSAVKDKYDVLNEEEAKQYESLLLNTLRGDLETVKASIDMVKKLRDPSADPTQPVGNLAAVKGHLHILQFMLARGARLDRDLAVAIRNGAKMSPEMLAYYEKDKRKYDQMIMEVYKPDPNHVPNVPPEWIERIEATCPR